MPVGGAIVGSAVIGGAVSASAANKAAKASQNATDQSTALQREALAVQQANTATARKYGDASIEQLATRFGLNGAAGGAAGSSPPAPTFNAESYLANNPDVAAAVQDPNSGYAGSTAEERAADHYARYGRNEGRVVANEVPAAPTTPATPAAPEPTVLQDTSSPIVPVYNRPDAMPAPTYTRPEYSAPLNVSYEDYLGSGDAKAAEFDIAKQGGQVQASLNAQGLLNSGAALKRLQEVGQNNKVKYFNQFRDYTTGQYNTDRARSDSNYNYDTALNQSNYQYGQNRSDNIFNVDRGYGTDLALTNRNYEAGQEQQQTSNLFNLANIGQGAAAQVNNATTNAANANSSALFSNAANQGNASLTNANVFNNLLGTGVNALAYYGAKNAGAAPAATSSAGTYDPYNVFKYGS